MDPVLLQIPTYFDVIPKKDARDLRTIKTKLESDKYDSVDAWLADTELMIRNAIMFNGADSEVGQIAIRLEGRVHDDVARLRSQLVNQQSGKKRVATGDLKGGPGVVQPPVKKLKLI